MFVTLNHWEWKQTAKSLLSMKNLEVLGKCAKECKTEGICCILFEGNVKITNTISNISEEQIFYFFNNLKDPHELLALFRDPSVGNLVHRERLTFDQQLKIALILDFCSIESFILQSVMDQSYNPICVVLIQNQKLCAIHFKDWTRYKYVIGLWESFMVSCLFVAKTNEIKNQLASLLQNFLMDDSPNDLFQYIASMTVNLLLPIIGSNRIIDIVKSSGKLERFMSCI
jgi:ABC-type transport system involved in multi-copper enzyme maturation permease subunit